MAKKSNYMQGFGDHKSQQGFLPYNITSGVHSFLKQRSNLTEVYTRGISGNPAGISEWTCFFLLLSPFLLSPVTLHILHGSSSSIETKGDF